MKEEKVVMKYVRFSNIHTHIQFLPNVECDIDYGSSIHQIMYYYDRLLASIIGGRKSSVRV